MKEMFKALLTEVAESHKNMFFYNCINPQNIAMQNGFILTLVDFTQFPQNFIYDLEDISTSSNKLAYQAPELLTKHIPYSQASDIYALGCVFAEIALGKPLFRFETSKKA